MSYITKILNKLKRKLSRKTYTTSRAIERIGDTDYFD